MIDPLGSARMAENQRYKITDRIDAGGMAEVYRGVAESAVGGLKKAVAIKRILPNLTKNKKFVSMFLDEARVSMHLQHANVVGVFDIGMADTAYFIVMEFVDGANLKTIIESLRRQGARMTVAHTLYILMEVCKGLQYAHDVTDPETGRELGIVHRDISPPNILVSKRGEVKLVDFGLAKATSQLESTDPGVVKGKFSYLSPEAASGKDVDRRADIFAVGILLYELLTGKRLFYGETDYQTVELVRQAKVPPIAAQNPEVTPELEQVVRKALARDLNQRFQSAGDLQDALAQYLFSQRLKVTSRDIEQLVQGCLREKQRSQPKAQPVGNLIDTLINEEIVKFTSLDTFAESGVVERGVAVAVGRVGQRAARSGAVRRHARLGRRELGRAQNEHVGERAQRRHGRADPAAQQEEGRHRQRRARGAARRRRRVDRAQAQERDRRAAHRQRVDAVGEGEPDLGADRGDGRGSDVDDAAEAEAEEGHRPGRRRRGGA